MISHRSSFCIITFPYDNLEKMYNTSDLKSINFLLQIYYTYINSS